MQVIEYKNNAVAKNMATFFVIFNIQLLRLITDKFYLCRILYKKSFFFNRFPNIFLKVIPAG